MAMSTCIKCGNHTFELVETNILNAAWKQYLIQCASCGGVVGVQEYNNLGAMLYEQNEALKRIANAVNANVSLPT